jgi:hypothetical protein
MAVVVLFCGAAGAQAAELQKWCSPDGATITQVIAQSANGSATSSYLSDGKPVSVSIEHAPGAKDFTFIVYDGRIFAPCGAPSADGPMSPGAVEGVIAIISSFTRAHWIGIAGIVVGIILWLATQYLTVLRERRKNEEATPIVRATINKDTYRDGWRSVQLHIMGASEEQQLNYSDWCIKRATLLRPWSAVLARAEKDDYATGVFDPKSTIRTLDGKAEGKPQRFALEFFIKFKGNDRGKRAKFKVAFARIAKPRVLTTKVWATIPDHAGLKTTPVEKAR